MISVQRRLPFLTLVLLVCSQVTFGGEYSDLSGFSFTYPEGWVPITQAMVGDFAQPLPSELKSWIARNNVNLNGISVMLIHDTSDEFHENLNVVIRPNQIPVDDKTLNALPDMIAAQYAAMDMHVENMQARMQKVGSRDAIALEYKARIPAMPEVLRQKQVMIPGGEKAYIVTCTARSDCFETYRPTFDSIIASFRTPAPIRQGFDWNQALMMGMWGAIIGGLAGGLGWIVKTFVKGSKSTKENANEPDPEQL